MSNKTHFIRLTIDLSSVRQDDPEWIFEGLLMTKYDAEAARDALISQFDFLTRGAIAPVAAQASVSIVRPNSVKFDTSEGTVFIPTDLLTQGFVTVSTVDIEAEDDE